MTNSCAICTGPASVQNSMIGTEFFSWTGFRTEKRSLHFFSVVKFGGISFETNSL